VTGQTGNAEPEWLVAGGQVIVYNWRSGARRAVIERLTKTQVILPDGQRFNRRTLSKRGTGVWDGSIELRDPADPDMLAKLASQRYQAVVASTRHILTDLMLAWSRAAEGDLSAAHAAAIQLRDAIADLEGDAS
jgi:hypothetical protein